MNKLKRITLALIFGIKRMFISEWLSLNSDELYYATQIARAHKILRLNDIEGSFLHSTQNAKIGLRVECYLLEMSTSYLIGLVVTLKHKSAVIAMAGTMFLPFLRSRKSKTKSKLLEFGKPFKTKNTFHQRCHGHQSIFLHASRFTTTAIEHLQKSSHYGIWNLGSIFWCYLPKDTL